jgi:hypothetical protein
MTDAWQLRRCSTCGVLETDLTANFVFDQASEAVFHIRGFVRCGQLVAVDKEVTRP